MTFERTTPDDYQSGLGDHTAAVPVVASASASASESASASAPVSLACVVVVSVARERQGPSLEWRQREAPCGSQHSSMTRVDRLLMYALTSKTWILESQSHGLKGDRHNCRRRRRRCEAPAPLVLLKGLSSVHADGHDDPRAFP